MKKKGLIISTVVMVVVLIASLTTATYAWFTTSTVTSIQGFNVEVVASNAVDIGLKTTCTYTPNPIDSDFVSGDVKYTADAPGTIGKGGWSEGTSGLSSTLNHGIEWGAQNKAVGITTETTKEAAAIDNTGLWNQTNGKTVIAANGAKDKSGVNILDQKDLAVANQHYAYFFLGARPTKDLASNELVLTVDATGSTNIGILAALHVAYRLNSAGEWQDADIFDGVNYGQRTAELDSNLSVTQKAAYKKTYNTDAPLKGIRSYAIPNLATTKGQIDQIEIVIYLAGSDEDCIDQAKGSKGSISMFFNAVDKEKSGAITNAKIEQGKLTLTGAGQNTDVYVKVDNAAEWTKVEGIWNTNTFTSNATLANLLKTSSVQVKQIEKGKTESDVVTIKVTSLAA